jgi:hypothetical protein
MGNNSTALGGDGNFAESSKFENNFDALEKDKFLKIEFLCNKKQEHFISQCFFIQKLREYHCKWKTTTMQYTSYFTIYFILNVEFIDPINFEYLLNYLETNKNITLEDGIIINIQEVFTNFEIQIIKEPC